MSSLKQAREMLSLALTHHFISEEEFLLLYDASFSKNPSFPHGDYDRFDLDAMDETECLYEFKAPLQFIFIPFSIQRTLAI